MFVDAADLCAAVETQLRTNVPLVITAMGLGTPLLLEPKQYQQDAKAEDLLVADYPAVGISSSGTIGEPIRTGLDVWSTVYSVEVVVVDHGDDFPLTQKRARRWASAVKAALLLDRSLDGIANSIRPGTESYLPPQAAGAAFIGAALIQFDVTVENAMDINAIRQAIAPLTDVTSVNPTVVATKE